MPDLDLVIKNARTVTSDPVRCHLGIRGGVIVSITDAGQPAPDAGVIIDAEGDWVIPGAIDTHTHIGQLAPEFADRPGFGHKDNYRYETQGAMVGGVTTVLNYAPFGQGSVVEAYQSAATEAREQSLVNVLVHGYIMNEDQLAELPKSVAAGMRTFKMFMPYRGKEACALGGIGSLNHAQLRVAFRAIAEQGCQALVHAEDGDIVEYCQAEELAAGMPDLASYERSRPADAEGDAAWTALYLADLADCPVTIVHVSSLEGMRARRAAGHLRASLESCPHYMILDTASPIGPAGKVAPPLRSPQLATAISDAVMAGEIDFFGSDHNVWPLAAKPNLPDGRAGLPGLALLLPLVLTHCVAERGMSMARAVELTSTNAADKFGLTGKGRVALGADADLVVLETGEHTVRTEELQSAVDYSPYEGTTLRLWPRVTVCGGQVVCRDGEVVDGDFRGQILNQQPA